MRIHPITLHAAVIAICGGAALACALWPMPSLSGGSSVSRELPEFLPPGYRSILGSPGELERKALPPDTEVLRRIYYLPDPLITQRATDIITASIVLSGADPRSIHRPEVCLVAQGWTITSSELLDVTVNDGTSFQVLDLTIERMEDDGNSRFIHRAHYMYWFVGNGVTTPFHSDRFFLNLKDNLLYNRVHQWAYLSVLADVTDNFPADRSQERSRSTEETRQLMVDLIRELAPRIHGEVL
jgi:hypothetical protein